MKKRNRLTALLLGAAMLGSILPVMPVSAAETGVVQAESAVQDDLTAFFERIAGWENVSPDDCIILEQPYRMVLTPTKPYTIITGTYLPYRVYLNGGTLDAAEINAKWKQRLEKGYAESFLNKNGGLDAQTCTVEQSGDCWLVMPSQEKYFVNDLLAVLKEIPAVQRVEVGRSYQTHGRVTTTSEYGLLFTVTGRDALTPADFPELDGVTLTGQIPMTGTTKTTWNLTLASDSYADYFAAVKYLQTLDFVKQLIFCFSADGQPDQSADAIYRSSDTVTVFDRSLERGSLTDFLERIAGWQGASLSECVRIGDNMLLTPDKPYTVMRVRYSPYRVSMKDGAVPDADAILAKWKEILLTAGYPEATLAHFTCEVTEADGGYEIQTLQDGYAGVSLLDCLKMIPDVQRVEAEFGYCTHDRPNAPFGFGFVFTVNGTDMPQPEDFPGLTGVQIAGDVPLMTQTKSTWSLKLTSNRYEDYFEAAKYLQTLDFVHDLRFRYGSTELGDGNDDAKILDPEPTVLFDRASETGTPADFARDTFFKCISSREDVRDEDCIRLGNDQLLTPAKPYTVQRSMCAPYRVFLRTGGSLDANAVLAKWKEMLLAEGCPEETLAQITCEAAEADGGYEIRASQDSYKSVSLADCLKAFPDVQRIETQYGYRSDDFANEACNFVLSFQYVSEIEITARVFPALDIAELAYKCLDPANPNGKWYLTLNSDAYADYFAAAKYLMNQEDVCQLRLEYAATQVALENEPRLTEWAPTVLFSRGDLNLDGTSDVSDAVLLARFLASDAEAEIADQGLVNADADGNGKVQGDDLTVILKRIAKQY